MGIKDSESAQVAHELLQLKDGGQEGEFDSELMKRYGITFENFHKLICDLTPLCDYVWSRKYGELRGFTSGNGDWLACVGKEETELLQ